MIGDPASVLPLWPQFTHIIFTSQTTVHYWPGPWDKKLIAIGPATATALQKKGLVPHLASQATQEGIMSILQPGYYFLPHSKRARPDLARFMTERGISFFALELYDTLLQRPEPVPRLADFDEIVFTSPSTVDGFLAIYKTLPPDKKLTAIGPITEAYLKKMGSEQYNRTQKR